MTRLAEIEAAVETLPAAEQQELLLFLAQRLRADRLPPPRSFSEDQLRTWIAEDEAEMRSIDPGSASAGDSTK